MYAVGISCNIMLAFTVATYRKILLTELNPLNAELNPIRHLLALAVAHHFVHVSRVRVKEREELLIYSRSGPPWPVLG